MKTAFAPKERMYIEGIKWVEVSIRHTDIAIESDELSRSKLLESTSSIELASRSWSSLTLPI